MKTSLYRWLPVLLLMGGCAAQPELSTRVQDMIVQTNYDNTISFSAYATYAMPSDTVGYVSKQYPNDTLITSNYATVVTTAVKASMQKAGYTLVAKNASPDLALNVYIVEDYTVFSQITSPSAFGPYSGYYYPSYYGYSGYAGLPYYQTYSIGTATLVMELVDLKNKNAQNQVKMIWNAYMGDVLTSVDPYTKSQEAIGQAFTQSPYIHH